MRYIGRINSGGQRRNKNAGAMRVLQDLRSTQFHAVSGNMQYPHHNIQHVFRRFKTRMQGPERAKQLRTAQDSVVPSQPEATKSSNPLTPPKGGIP